MQPEIRTEQQPQGILGRRISSALGDITLGKVVHAGFANAQANAVHIANGKSILELQSTPVGEGLDALVIAAGPSLHRFNTAQRIKDSKFRGTIIVTESAMAWCLRNGILPHLVITLDPRPYYPRIDRWFGDPKLTEDSLSRDDYFARQDMDPNFRQRQLEFNRELLQLVDQFGSRIRIAVASCSAPSVVERVHSAGMSVYWWNPMYDDYDMAESLTRKIHTLNGLPCVNTGGNVGSACWVFAHAVLGKTRIGLVGMDFGYYGDTPYNQTQYYKEILALVGPDRLDDVFVPVRNPFLGANFYTDPAYLWYRDAFAEMVQEAECKTFNCTGGGILFGPGIQWTTLDEFLSTCQS